MLGCSGHSRTVVDQSALLSIGGAVCVSWTYLLDVKRRLYLWNVGVEVAFERLDIDGLSNSSCHD